MNKPEILIIDDEPQISRLLSIVLETNGYKVLNAKTGHEGLAMAASHTPDLILLDIGLPDKNGHEVLKELRQWFTNAILILSVQQDEEDIVGALDHGADDYLTKPFRTGELLARIRASLKHNTKTAGNSKIQLGDLTFDFESMTVLLKGNPIKLTATEYQLLTLLAKNEGKVLTHAYLLKEIWGPGYSGETQYLRVFIAQLRKKIEDNPNQPKYINTESRVGYRFVAENGV